jgi:hypothetical protein
MNMIQQRAYNIYLLAIVLALQACAITDPIAKADTLEQKAFATYGTFVIFEEQAAKLVSSGELSDSAVRAIGRADERAKPVVDSLIAAAVEFAAIKAEYEASGEGEERFIAAMNELNVWVSRAAPLVDNLIAAIEGAE